MDMELDYRIAADARTSERAAFIRRTYAHLAGAILAFAALEVVLFNYAPPVVVETILRTMMGSRFSWLFVLGGFMLVSWIAQSWARSDTSRGLQYLGLGLYVVAEAVLFVPLLFAAQFLYPDQHLVAKAGIMTLAVFGGLTLAVFVSGKDFSGLRTVLCVGSLLAFGFIVASILFQFEGMVVLIFCFAMVALASGWIIYQTSNVIHHYRTDQYVAASLALFAAVALLFWYILEIFLLRSRR
ncbi:MAG TPA: Bax inhibitor-1 family protein [Gemmataceae bacterium]|nr:Bax inhibitor-1 family protein [Gemmataceae bacterium]